MPEIWQNERHLLAAYRHAMPNILALDTSTDACSVALACEGRVSNLFELAAKSHTQRLLPMVDELLRDANCSLKQLDAIAYGAGPGSFTGLRICLGVVQGLAFGANLPVIPVSTLAAMAQGYYREETGAQGLPLLVALDARMHEVYWSLFEYRGGVVVKQLDEAVCAPSEVAGHPRIEALQGRFHACGQGWHYTELKALNPLSLREEFYPRAEDMLTLALNAHARGETLSATEAEPVYLRDQVTWQKRQRIRSN
jgi:tRNA threonylcarbamoyladenosine biosynthesis protein TsaB